MRPYIEATITRGSKYAWVETDFWSLCFELTEEGMARLRQLHQEYVTSKSHEIKKERMLNKLRMEHGLTVVRFHILKEDAETIKQRLEDIINNPVCLYRPQRLQKGIRMIDRLFTNRKNNQDGRNEK